MGRQAMWPGEHGPPYASTFYHLHRPLLPAQQQSSCYPKLPHPCIGTGKKIIRVDPRGSRFPDSYSLQYAVSPHSVTVH